MKIWRKFLPALVIVLVVLAVVYGFMPKPVPVDLAEVSMGPLMVTVVEEGKTRVTDRYVISAPVSGYARRIQLDAGDPVEKKQVVATLEPLRSEVLDPRSRAEAEARLESAKASYDSAQENVKAARADAELAATELKRIEGIFDKGFVAKDELDRARALAERTAASLSSAKFSVDVAAHEVEAARSVLKYSAAEGARDARRTVSVKAPVEGTVLKVLRKSEGVVASGEGLLEIGDPATIEVEVDVLSDDAVRIGSGTKVLLERWGGEGALEGRVRVVEPHGFTKISALGIEEQRVLVIVDIISPKQQWARLGDGYRVEARFVLWEGADILQVPQSALFRYQDGWAVFVVNNNRAEMRKAVLDHRSGLAAEVVSGLSAGERVVVHPDAMIEHGTAVKQR